MLLKFKSQSSHRSHIKNGCLPFQLLFIFLQIGLNLLTTNTSSEQSVVVDGGTSLDSEEKKAKNEVINKEKIIN